jgi:hypothetical protein
MCALSATEPSRLSAEHEALLPAYRSRWEQVRCNTAPADRCAAEAGVALAYEAAGLPPPQRIEWSASPIATEVARKNLWHRFDPGPSVKVRIVDEVIRAVETRVEERVPVRIRVAAKNELDIEPRFSSASSALSDAFAAETARVGWGISGRTRSLLRRLRGDRPSPFAGFQDSRWLCHESIGVLAKNAFLHDVCGYQAETSALAGLRRIAETAGAMVPHQRVCWLSERHVKFERDPNGRLHCATGPAVLYPDKWCYHAWKGVAVPKWIIENSHRICSRTIDNERDPIIRRCMIDIMTPERYISTGAARRVAVDTAGILWRKNWHNWWDAWAAVEVVNGTLEPDGTRKRYYLQVPPEMRTPTEAVAWTYGMSAARYSDLKRRT